MALRALPAALTDLQAGMGIGPYRLLRPLGSGGMGTVWLAEQTEPLQREVAIKLMACSLDDPMAEACFMVERQALARLVHPCIAQIYDAGQLPGGVLFFALEFVEGRTLDDFVDQRRPSTTQVTILFEQLCDGMQHAHQRGLIHRDLKPGNLLVREEGSQIIPKIIDFGIAVGASAGEPVQIERVAVGTLSYMAPEQAIPDESGIDARVDLYALGITLGKMLCLRAGQDVEAHNVHPWFAASLSPRAAQAEHGQGLAQIRQIRANVPKELRAIVAKATDSDRSRRYESAAALAADLRNWRSDRRVLAMGDSASYSVQLLYKRHRLASVGAALALAAVLIGSAVAWYGLTQARTAHALAEQRRVQAEELLGAMLGDLANRLRPLGRLDLLETVASEAMQYLSAAQASASGALGALQRVRALRTLGEVYNGRQQWGLARSAFEEAEATLQAAQPQDNAAWLFEAAQISYWLGFLHYRGGDQSASEARWTDYLKYAERLQPLTSDSGTGLLETSYALNNLGVLNAEAGRLDQAIAQYQRAVELTLEVRATRPDDAALANDLADNYSWIASAEEQRGRPDVALDYYQRQLELTTQALTARPDEARWYYHKGVALHWIGLMRDALGHGDARAALQQSVDSLQAAVTADGSNRQWRRSLASAWSDLGWHDALMGDLPLAMSSLRSALAQSERLEGDSPDARTTLTLMRARARLATALFRNGDRVAADAEMATALKLFDQLPDAQKIQRGEGANMLWQAAAISHAPEDAEFKRAKAATLVNGLELGSRRYADLEARALREQIAGVNRDGPALVALTSTGYDPGRLRRLLRIYGVQDG